MKVIVAGHQKTGTKTLNDALTILGYNVYDFLENYYYLGNEWKQIFNNGSSDEIFQRMYGNVDAVCDLPSFVFWQEIHKAFPDSKIILSVRENEDIWYESLLKQLKSNNINYTLMLVLFLSPSAIFNILIPGVQGARVAYGISSRKLFSNTMNKTLAQISYRKHNADVMTNAPKDKLLVYNCKEGWEPLCKFLGKDIPDVPFPFKNKGGSIFDDLLKSNEILVRMKREAFLVGSCLLACVSAGIFAGLNYLQYI